MVSGSQVRGSAFLFPLMPWSQDHRSEGVCFCVPMDAMVSGSQVRGSAFLFVFPSMSWYQNHRSEGVRFCLCAH